MYYILMLGFILFMYINPIIIVFQYNVVLEEGGYNLNFFGIMMAFILIGVAYKVLSKRINIWDIQNRNKAFRVIFSILKTLLLIGSIWWIFETINMAYDKIHMTLMLTFFSMLVGAGLRLLALRLEYKKSDPV